MEQLLIWVDEQDEIIGYGEKMDTHVREQLHRAFSIFIVDRRTERILIQRRAMGKYHSGGKWSNACCSHPRKGETMEDVLKTRLQEELGIDVPEIRIGGPDGNEPFHHMGKFIYYAPFDGLAEHEIDNVFVYEIPEELVERITPDPEEAEEVKWLSLAEIDDWYEKEPEAFSAWFKEALELARPKLKGETKMRDILIVVDMQNDFIDGALGTPEAVNIVDNVVNKVKNFPGKVIYTRDTHFDNYMETQEGKNLPVPHCIEGTDGWQVCPALEELRTGCETFDKVTFGSRELGMTLAWWHEEDPIGSVELVGLCTDICVISNAMIVKAFLPEAKVTVDASCCAGVTVESHKNALEAMKVCQIQVINE